MSLKIFVYENEPTNYRVDADGSIYCQGRRLKPFNHGGYSAVNLTISGKAIQFLVHRIVATCYLPNPENKATVNHINGIKHDNRVVNLEWATQSENNKHAYDTGLKKVRGNRANLLKNRHSAAASISKRHMGENNPSAKLTQAQAEQIRNELSQPKYGDIKKACKTYGVSESAIYAVRRNVSFPSL